MIGRHLRSRDDSSSVESLHAEDLNIPLHVDCRQKHDVDDGCSVRSEVSDGTMQFYGLEYNCKPDIGEIANMTLDVNYGDLANMACGSTSPSFRSLVMDPIFSVETNDENLTWSQLLDHEARPVPPVKTLEEGKSISHLWTRGHEESLDTTRGIPSPFDKVQQMENARRTSDTMSLMSASSGFSRPRPLNAIKRFWARRRRNGRLRKAYSRQLSSATHISNKSSPPTMIVAIGV